MFKRKPDSIIYSLSISDFFVVQQAKIPTTRTFKV